MIEKKAICVCTNGFRDRPEGLIYEEEVLRLFNQTYDCKISVKEIKEE